MSLGWWKGGSFKMGDDVGDLHAACRPVHQVKLSSFYMGIYPVTQELWDLVMGSNPSYFKGAKRPVENVSWNDTQHFLTKLNERSGKIFRLPTEAEWEYAARGGHLSIGYTYSGSDKLKQVGWNGENSNNETHEVGQLLVNELGLYDMSGNVWEWCADWYEEDYYQRCKDEGVVENPVNTVESTLRVLRGGGFFYGSVFCRSAHRYWASPDFRVNSLGFRLVLAL